MEIFSYSRVRLEEEYWPGNRSDPINPRADIDAYVYDSNQESLWRTATYNGVNPPTHVNDDASISGQNTLLHFHYKEKTACTCEQCFPPFFLCPLFH